MRIAKIPEVVVSIDDRQQRIVPRSEELVTGVCQVGRNFVHGGNYPYRKLIRAAKQIVTTGLIPEY
jgi:hypothetical protein